MRQLVHDPLNHLQDRVSRCARHHCRSKRGSVPHRGAEEPTSPVAGLTRPVDPPKMPDLGRGASRNSQDTLYRVFVGDALAHSCSGPAPFFEFDSNDPKKDQPTMQMLANCMIDSAQGQDHQADRAHRSARDRGLQRQARARARRARQAVPRHARRERQPRAGRQRRRGRRARVTGQVEEGPPRRDPARAVSCQRPPHTYSTRSSTVVYVGYVLIRVRRKCWRPPTPAVKCGVIG